MSAPGEWQNPVHQVWVIADAAVAYVAARFANDAAEPCDWSARAAELERTWHELVEASGLSLTPSETP